MQELHVKPLNSSMTVSPQKSCRLQAWPNWSSSVKSPAIWPGWSPVGSRSSGQRDFTQPPS
jgi:hypothetical protein